MIHRNHRPFILGIASAGLSLTPLAHAADAPASAGHALELGARLGFSLPLGSFRAQESIALAGTSLQGPTESLSDHYGVRIPIAIDVGYRLVPSLMLGVYAQYGFISGKSGAGCGGCTNDAAHDVSFGVQAQYHFLPSGPIDPWLGLGVGYEYASQNATPPLNNLGGPVEAQVTYRGPQLLNLQGGVNFKVNGALELGPFLSFSVAEFTNESGASIGDKALHEWLSIGIKGTLGI
jgi:hypothetical protein